MHSRIIQISTKPIEGNDYITGSDYYEDFVGRIADYVSDDTDRDNDIEWFKNCLNGVAEFNGDEFVITNQRKYFEAKFKKFAELIGEIAHATYEEFCTGKLEDKVWELEDTYADKFDFYVDDGGEYGGLEPLDDFMRHVKNGDKFYIGRTVDYHW